jgi:glycolate oxidase FAD binding subunit
MTSSATDGIEAIRHALPADLERSTHAFAIDGVEPRAAFAPDDEFEVAEILKIADDHELAVVPQGTRTALALGRPLAAYDVALELRGLHRVVEYVPADLTITVEAGMHLDALQEVLGDHGQYLSIDPPPDDHVSIGGLLATARAGAWRGHLPAARDLILGLQTALPSGELTQSGGRVVKNVTGYDLHRLHTGALGALGVITKAAFKVAPHPPLTRTVRLSAASTEDAAALARRVWNESLAIRAITVLPPPAAEEAGLPASPAVLVDCAGSEAAVERSLRDLASLATVEDADPAAWRTLRRLAGDQQATVIRLGVPPTAIEETLRALDGAGCTAWAHVAAGAVLAHTSELPAERIEHLRTEAVAHGGFLQIEAGSPELRRAVDPFGADQAATIRALKDQFDPKRTLNRGRWPEDV